MIPLLTLAATLLIGAWAARKTRGAADFFAAGRQLGAFRAGLGAAASSFSGFVFLGGTGLMHEVGTGALFLVVPIGFTAALVCRTVGRRLALIAEASGAYTIPEALRFRFGSRFPAGVAAVAILLGSVLYLGVQAAALSLAMRFAFPDLGVAASLGIGLAVLLAYSLLGGMIASVNTDVFQGLLMAAGALFAFTFVLDHLGGFGETVATLERLAPEQLAPTGSWPPGTGVGMMLLFGLGVFGQPHSLHKFLMLKSPDALRFLPMVLGGAHALSLLVWIGLGLGAMVFAAEGRLGELGHPDEAAFLVLGAAEAPALLLGLVTAALLAAILSTADTFLNLGAAALVRDIPRALGHAGWSGLRAARGAALLVGLVALGIAAAHLGGGELIAWLGTLAFGAFASGLAPVLTLGLLLPEVSARCAGLAMAAGLASHLLLEGQGLVIPPALAGMVTGFVILLAGAFIAPEKSVPSRVRLALTL